MNKNVAGGPCTLEQFTFSVDVDQLFLWRMKDKKSTENFMRDEVLWEQRWECEYSNWDIHIGSVQEKRKTCNGQPEFCSVCKQFSDGGWLGQNQLALDSCEVPFHSAWSGFTLLKYLPHFSFLKISGRKNEQLTDVFSVWTPFSRG